MNLKEKIATMRQALAAFTATFKFADYKTVDGSAIVRIDGEPVAGTMVYVLDEAGNILPAPDGEHALADLGTITVEGGVLTAAPVMVEAPVVEEALADPAEAAAAVEEVASVVEGIAPELPAEEAAVIATDVVAEIQEKILALEGVVEEMKKKMSAMGAANTAFASAIEELAAMPSAPAKTAVAGVIETAKHKEREQFSAIANNIRNLKK